MPANIDVIERCKTLAVIGQTGTSSAAKRLSTSVTTDGIPGSWLDSSGNLIVNLTEVYGLYGAINTQVYPGGTMLVLGGYSLHESLKLTGDLPFVSFVNSALFDKWKAREVDDVEVSKQSKKARLYPLNVPVDRLCGADSALYGATVPDIEDGEYYVYFWRPDPRSNTTWNDLKYPVTDIQQYMIYVLGRGPSSGISFVAESNTNTDITSGSSSSLASINRWKLSALCSLIGFVIGAICAGFFCDVRSKGIAKQ